MKALLFTLIATFVFSVAPALAEVRVIEARWRPDANPFTERQVWDGYYWSEGWSEPDQFYPKHFHPAGSLHVVLGNDTTSPKAVKLTAVDGKPIGDIATTPRRAGPVVWYWVEPATMPAGGWTECIVRLRSAPAKDVRLAFEDSQGNKTEVVAPVAPPKVRIESVSFSPAIDRAYVYLRALDGSRVKSGSVLLDGAAPKQKPVWTPGPAKSGLVLVEAPIDPAWEYGSNHLIEVKLPGHGTLACPVRAWDNYFSVGLFGPADKASAADTKAAGFNTYYWNTGPVLHEAGLNYIPQYLGDEGRPRTPKQTGALFMYNLDEPDGHDFGAGKELPCMDRLGVSANLQVIPFILDQRAKHPTIPNMVLINNTYKPLNWYVYGQIADVTATDPYVPLSGTQIEHVPFTLSTARDACAPHPLVGVIWATCGANHKWGKRWPTLEEERMMAFYALGCGVKGIGYFADYEQNGDQEGLKAVSDYKELWDEIRRINADIAALAPLLSIGCPSPGTKDTEDVWVRSIMCGPDTMVVIAVNKRHHIGFCTSTEFAWHSPATDVELDIPLPPHFSNCEVRELRGGALAAPARRSTRGRVVLKLDELDTARAFVVTTTAKER